MDRSTWSSRTMADLVQYNMALLISTMKRFLFTEASVHLVRNREEHLKSEWALAVGKRLGKTLNSHKLKEEYSYALVSKCHSFSHLQGMTEIS